jgi:hypothetical protein
MGELQVGGNSMRFCNPTLPSPRVGSQPAEGSSAEAAWKETLCRRNSGVRFAQAIRHYMHDFQREIRSLRDQRFETAAVEFQQFALRHRDNRRTAGRIVDEGHFSEDGSGTASGLLTAGVDGHFAVKHDVHRGSYRSFLDDGLPRRVDLSLLVTK